MGTKMGTPKRKEGVSGDILSSREVGTAKNDSGAKVTFSGKCRINLSITILTDQLRFRFAYLDKMPTTLRPSTPDTTKSLFRDRPASMMGGGERKWSEADLQEFPTTSFGQIEFVNEDEGSLKPSK